MTAEISKCKECNKEFLRTNYYQWFCWKHALIWEIKFWSILIILISLILIYLFFLTK